MRKLFLLYIACGILLTGCAGVSFETKRFVENNAFHSSQFPSLTVYVTEKLKYVSDKSGGYEGANQLGNRNTSIESTTYHFQEPYHSKKRLNILIETLNDPRWYMELPDYSEEEYLITTGKEVLGGVAFHTGIFVVPKENHNLLIKVYGKTSGDRVRFQIFYIEQVKDEWLKQPVMYTSKQREALIAFKRRAQESFAIGEYREPVISESNTNNITAPASTKNEKAHTLSAKDRFQNIKDLYESGLMTEEEYQSKRKQIMSEL